MKFITALITTYAGVNASSLESKSASAAETKADTSTEAKAGADLNPQHQYTGTDPYVEYFNHPGYMEPNYEHVYSGVLPNADFNKRVYEFDDSHQCFS